MNSRRFLKAGGFHKFPGEQDVKKCSHSVEISDCLEYNSWCMLQNWGLLSDPIQARNFFAAAVQRAAFKHCREAE